MTTTSIRPVAPVQQAMAGPRFWMTRAAYGFLLGAVIASLEFAYYAPVTSRLNEVGSYSFILLLLVWCGEGVLLALFVGLAEHRVSPRELSGWRLALAIGAGVLASVLIWQAFAHFLLRDLFGIRLFTDHVGQPVVWLGGVLYHAWLMFFFSGLAAAVYAAQRWRARMLAMLRAAELDRATSQQRLAEVNLAALRARVEPDFLFQALARLEHLYDTDPTAADRLLDELIAFLRNTLTESRASATAAGNASPHGEPDPAGTFVVENPVLSG